MKGGHLVAKVKELIHEGNVRRIVINDADGKQVLDMPVSVGVIGLLVAPTVTAVGTLGALAADYSIDVEREQPATAAPNAKREEQPMSGYRNLPGRITSSGTRRVISTPS